MGDLHGVIDPVFFLRFCACIGYDPEDIAQALVEGFDVEPGVALDLARAALRQRQERELAEEADYLAAIAARAEERGLPFEFVLKEA